jgi:trehalose/maltose hydrolase-like predicted phosphorylase
MWVFPAMLAFAPSAAKAMLDYRIARTAAAGRVASAGGYSGTCLGSRLAHGENAIDGIVAAPTVMLAPGLQFPWESAATGDEVCPIDSMAAGTGAARDGVTVLTEHVWY